MHFRSNILNLFLWYYVCLFTTVTIHEIPVLDLDWSTLRLSPSIIKTALDICLYTTSCRYIMSSLAALARDLGLIPGYSLNYHHVREGSYLRMEKWRSFFILELPIVNMEKQHVPLGIGAHYIIKELWLFGAWFWSTPGRLKNENFIVLTLTVYIPLADPDQFPWLPRKPPLQVPTQF